MVQWAQTMIFKSWVRFDSGIGHFVTCVLSGTLYETMGSVRNNLVQTNPLQRVDRNQIESKNAFPRLRTPEAHQWWSFALSKCLFVHITDYDRNYTLTSWFMSAATKHLLFVDISRCNYFLWKRFSWDWYFTEKSSSVRILSLLAQHASIHCLNHTCPMSITYIFVTSSHWYNNACTLLCIVATFANMV